MNAQAIQVKVHPGEWQAAISKKASTSYCGLAASFSSEVVVGWARPMPLGHRFSRTIRQVQRSFRPLRVSFNTARCDDVVRSTSRVLGSHHSNGTGQHS